MKAGLLTVGAGALGLALAACGSANQPATARIYAARAYLLGGEQVEVTAVASDAVSFRLCRGASADDRGPTSHVGVGDRSGFGSAAVTVVAVHPGPAGAGYADVRITPAPTPATTRSSTLPGTVDCGV